MAARSVSRWSWAIENDFSLGMIRDLPRTSIPPGGCYDLLNAFTHRPGKLFKRGGTSYASTACTGSTALFAITHANLLTGRKIVAVGMDNTTTPTTLRFYDVTSGTAVDLGPTVTFGSDVAGMLDKPKVYLSGSQSIVVFPLYRGNIGDTPWYWDGANVPQAFQGSARTITSGTPGTTDQTLTISGTPTGGTFKLDIVAQADGDGVDQPSIFRTAAIARNASAANVVTAINTAIAATAQFVTGAGGALPGTPVVITLPAGYGLTYVPAAQSGVSLTGGTNPNGKITTTSASTSTVDAVSVPPFRFCCVHLERLVGASSIINQNRLWFGPLLNATSSGWDTANAWIDLDQTIRGGVASLSGQLLAFSEAGMYRITGDIPPPDSNMLVQQMSDVGCSDARSLTLFGGQCVFANPKSVYVTTGIGPVSLMEDRIESYWQDLLATAGYDNANDIISTGVYGNRFLFVSFYDAGNATDYGLVCDLTRRAWGRIDNLGAAMYSSSYGVDEELYVAPRRSNRPLKLSGLFRPVAGNKNDADGTAVTMTVETRTFGNGMGLKAFGDAEVLLDMRDAATDNPTLAVSVAPGVEATTYAATAESPLAETTDLARKRVTVSKDSECVSLKLVQSNASSKTEVFGVEWSQRPYGPQAEGQ